MAGKQVAVQEAFGRDIRHFLQDGLSATRGRRSNLKSEFDDMIERIRSIREQGKEIVLVDLSNCRPSEVETVARNFPAYVTTRDRGSVLLLVDFSGASVDKETVRTMKESAVFDKPYINRSAWIGAQNFPPEFHKEITTFSRREMPIFDSRQEAIDWLVQD